jgi:hypothetical protein
VNQFGSLAATVRAIRFIPGYEKTSIKELIGWIRGADKNRAGLVYHILIGLSWPERWPGIRAMQLRRNLKTLQAVELILTRHPEDSEDLRKDIRRMKAENRHELTQLKKEREKSRKENDQFLARARDR